MNKQLLDEVFVISEIIKVEVSVISQSRRLRLITLTLSSSNFSISCWVDEANREAILNSLSANLTLLSVHLTLLSVHLTLLLEIMHCARNLQIVH